MLVTHARSQRILLLRRFLLASDASATVSHLGVHLCKVTFLSWSRQLGLNEELRRHQGHHRAPAGGGCVDLYSRDDVHPALEPQRILRAKVGAGFRPVVPVARGFAPSVQDRPVVIPSMPLSHAVDTPTSIHVESADDHVDTDSEASDDDEMDVDESRELPSQPPVQADVSDCVFLLNDASMVAHFASECDFDDPSRAALLIGKANRLLLNLPVEPENL